MNADPVIDTETPAESLTPSPFRFQLSGHAAKVYQPPRTGHPLTRPWKLEGVNTLPGTPLRATEQPRGSLAL